MSICKECGKEFSDLGKHLKHHHITSKEYYDKHVGSPNVCPVCGKETGFCSLTIGYYICCSRKCSQNAEHTIKKKKETFMNNYGSEYYMSSAEGKEKIKNGFIKKYGEDNPMKCPEVREKLKQSIINKFGVDNVSKNKEIMDKIQKGRKETFYNRLIDGERVNNLCKPDFTIDQFNGVLDEKQYPWICNQCNKRFFDSINNGEMPRCPSCFPKAQVRYSSYELEIIEFLKTLGFKDHEILKGSRIEIFPLELDIYIPCCNFAIEFDGIYWHSEDGPNHTSSKYHLKKTRDCNKLGIDLLHIFEDDWINKKEIVQSIIRNLLKVQKNIISSSSCNILSVSEDVSAEFLEKNHLNSHDLKDSTSLGLYYKDVLLSIMLFSHTNQRSWILMDYVELVDHSVMDGFSTLLLQFIEDYNPLEIITVHDRKYPVNPEILFFGFQLVKKLNPTYYILDGTKRLGRLQRLGYENPNTSLLVDCYDSSMSDWENLKNNRYNRIWDCGHLVYSYV
jgi:DNA-directed RNA polymerase subunit RPC12/RpoP